MKQPVYKHLARLIDSYHRCKETNNPHMGMHEERIEKIVKDHLPSGSGVDNGTSLDFDRSSKERLVFTMGFHHMDEYGYYDGWTEHEVIVTPSLAWGFDLRITGRNKRDIKMYLGDLYHDALSEMTDPYAVTLENATN